MHARIGSRTFSGTVALTYCLYGAVATGPLFLALDLVQAQGYTRTEAGLAVLPAAVVVAGLSRLAGGLAGTYGSRPFLIVGPAVAGAGMALLASAGLTAGPADYCSAFLPGLAVQGVGLGLTLAPLRATALSSVAPEPAGTASGTFNAMAPVATLSTVAIVGSIAIGSFAASLQWHTDPLQVSEAARQALELEARRLGEASVPVIVEPAVRDAVALAMRHAFVDAYRRALSMCAGLAGLGSVLAAATIRPKGR